MTVTEKIVRFSSGKVLAAVLCFFILPLSVVGSDLTILYSYDGSKSIDTTRLNEGIEFIHSYLLQVYELKKLEEVDTIRINLIDSYEKINSLPYTFMLPITDKYFWFYSAPFLEVYQ